MEGLQRGGILFCRAAPEAANIAFHVATVRSLCGEVRYAMALMSAFHPFLRWAQWQLIDPKRTLRLERTSSRPDALLANLCGSWRGLLNIHGSFGRSGTACLIVRAISSGRET